MKKFLCLLRHASISSEYHGCYIGKKDISVSTEGLAETKILAKEIPSRFHEGKIYLSPSIRAKETFSSLGFPENGKPEIIEELQELDFGDWEGKRFSELFKCHSQELGCWGNFNSEFQFPGGESIEQFGLRAERIRDLILSSKYKNILILSHGGILSLLLALLLGLPLASYTKFRLSPAGYALLEVFQNGDSVLTDLVGISKNRRSEWPG